MMRNPPSLNQSVYDSLTVHQWEWGYTNVLKKFEKVVDEKVTEKSKWILINDFLLADFSSCYGIKYEVILLYSPISIYDGIVSIDGRTNMT